MAKRKRGSNTGVPGLSFSWKKALGITKAKRKIAKTTGVPTTSSGRQRKLGKIMTGGGCLLPILTSALFVIVIVAFLI